MQFHLYEISRISKFLEAESRLVVFRDWKEGESDCLTGVGLFWGVIKMFGTRRGGGCTTCECTKENQTIHF